MDLTVLENKYLIALVGAICGGLITLLTQRILNKRGLFTYFVRHFLVGLSAGDKVFGAVRVTWNDNPVDNLYLSTIELTNRSMKDYENVVVRVYTGDTMLLTERTEIVGTTHIVKWTEEFSKALNVAPNDKPSEQQLDSYFHRRDYIVPTMNRGQVVRFQFLNAAKTQNQPSIWIDVLHKGVRLRFRAPQNEIFGIPRPMASLAGIVLGFVLAGFIIILIKTVWIATLCSLIYGLMAQTPGAWIIRIWRRLRDWFGD